MQLVTISLLLLVAVLSWQNAWGEFLALAMKCRMLLIIFLLLSGKSFSDDKNFYRTALFSNTAYKVCLPSRVIFQISVPSSIGTPRPLVIVNSGTPILPFIPAVKPYEMNGQGFLKPRPLDTKVFQGTFLCRLKFSRQQYFVWNSFFFCDTFGGW